MEVQDDQHIRDNLWVEQETKTKTLVADKIDVRKAFITTINKGSCNFVIDHAKKPGYKLRYTCMEGPTKDVFVRGRLKNNDIITLPEEWEWLVHQDSITVNLTPIGSPQILFVRGKQGLEIKIDHKLIFQSTATTRSTEREQTLQGNLMFSLPKIFI